DVLDHGLDGVARGVLELLRFPRAALVEEDQPVVARQREEVGEEVVVRGARPAVEDDQRLPLPQDLVVEENAVGVDVALGEGVDRGDGRSRFGMRSGRGGGASESHGTSEGRGAGKGRGAGEREDERSHQTILRRAVAYLPPRKSPTTFRKASGSS